MVMTQVTVAEAQQRLPDLLCAVEAGEEVQICAEDGRTFRLAATRPPVTGVPKAGLLKGRLVVPAEFDEPFEELREYMEGHGPMNLDHSTGGMT
jgi:antitoxin (DNA-binding transcriptional repressor) of toxin-antitoxin stability system